MRGRRKTLKISEAEWSIMMALWDGCEKKGEGLTLGEITSALNESTGWNSTTIRTLTIRLAEKDAVEIDKSSGIYKYSPKTTKAEAVRVEVDSFVKRVFDGSASELMAYLAREGNLTGEEKRDLIEVLGQNGEPQA